MIPIESLDIRRSAPQTAMVHNGATVQAWTRDRVAIHMAQATAFGQRAVLKRKRRLWPWLLALYGTPIALAVSVIVALWLLRHGL